MFIGALHEIDSSFTAHNPNESMTVDDDEKKPKASTGFPGLTAEIGTQTMVLSRIGRQSHT